MRRCITPGCTNTTNRTRCPTCEHAHQHQRNQSRPHYQGDWPAIARAAKQAEPWCHRPGGCPHPDAGTPTNPLQAGHVTSRSLTHGVVVLCRRCNIEQGDRDLTALGG